jgi:hypothetical protein
VVALAYSAALLVLLAAVAGGIQSGPELMRALNLLSALIAIACLGALGRLGWRSLPWRAIFGAGLPLVVLAVLGSPVSDAGPAVGAAAAVTAAVAVVTLSWVIDPNLRRALGR